MDNPKIREESSVRNLLDRMPQNVADSFSDEQLLYLKIALGSRGWGRHKVDFRGTFLVPFVSSNMYYVFLLGKNHRELTRGEKSVSSIIFILFIFLSVLGGLLILYLVKSALGIDLIRGFSFGIWGWFKGL